MLITLAVLLAVLKLAGVLAISWWLVALPLGVWLAFAAVFVVLKVIVAVAEAL